MREQPSWSCGMASGPAVLLCSDHGGCGSSLSLPFFFFLFLFSPLYLRLGFVMPAFS